MAAVSRLTFSLSQSTAKDLTYISRRLGISRSGLADQVLSGACHDMIQVIESLPTVSAETEEELDGQAKRLRGASIKVVANRLHGLRESLDAL